MALTRPKYSNIVDTDYKASVRAITTTNITLSGSAPSTYDGLTLVAGDRILVNAQSTGSQNGIYIVSVLGTGSNGTWIRSVDSSASAYVTAGMRTYVAEGTYAGTEYRLVTPDPIVLGTTSLTFQSTAATVSGVTKGVQYNNAGFIAGATSLIYDNATGNVVAAATTASTTSDTGALVVKGGTGIGGRLNVGGVATFNSNVVIVGNLTTLGNTFITNSTDLSIQDSIINLHSPTDLTPLVTNDGLDIGLKLHYYDTVDSAAFIGRDNATGYLVWEDKGSDVGGVFTSTSLGTFKVGNILLTGNTYRGTSTIDAAVKTYPIAYTTTSGTPPASPQVGDQWYDTSTDTLYEWVSDGTSSYWVDKLSQPVAISFASQATTPIGPKQGDLWYDTSSDILYTRVYDGSSSYWVDYSTAGVSTVAGLGALISNVSVGNIIATSIQSTVSAPIATTVANSVGYLGVPINNQSSSYTLALTDQGKSVYFTASSQTVTVPPYSSVAFPVGATATVILYNTGTMSIAAGSGVTVVLAGNTTAKSTWTLGANGVCTLLNVSQNIWFASGSLT